MKEDWKQIEGTHRQSSTHLEDGVVARRYLNCNNKIQAGILWVWCRDLLQAEE